MKKQDLLLEAELLLKDLPDETSWDDLMYRIYVRQKVERGIASCEAGEVYSTEEVRNHFAAKR